MIIDEIKFTENFRTYKKGQVIPLKDRVTIFAGDNGAGKSSLLGAIRGHFKTTWTPSQILTHRDTVPVQLVPTIEDKSALTYIDLASDHIQARTEFDYDNMDVHVAAMKQSSGQATLTQAMRISMSSKKPLVIFDEPERGLSMARQMVLAHALKTVVDHRPDTQFIISTHSIEIMKIFGSKLMLLPSAVEMSLDEYIKLATDFGRNLAAKYSAALAAELQ